MKLAIVIPVINQHEITNEVLKSFKETQSNYDNLYIIVDNGSQQSVREWIIGLTGNDIVIRNDVNVGLVKALNQSWQLVKNTDIDYVLFTHNDVMMYEKGWDSKLLGILENENRQRPVGVAGFYGAKGIGTLDIYKSPYRKQQMIRLENVSDCNRMDKLHGYRNISNGICEDVAVMDGFSLIVNVKLLNELGGFDRNYPPHHMYDNDICLESLDKGYRNIVVSMDCQHLGGRTDIGEDWVKPFNKTRDEIHDEAHVVFYRKWAKDMVEKGKHKICLPVRV